MSTVDVTEYGAEGDGSADDSDAIQSAIDDASDGDTVYFPEPSSYYNVYPGDSGRADAVTISGDSHADNLTLEGENRNTKIQLDGSTTVNHSILRLKTPENHSVTVRSLVFDGNKSQVAQEWPSFCILARDNGATDTGAYLFEDVIVQNCVGHGTGMQYGGVVFNRVTVRDCRRHGITFNTGYSGRHSPVPVLKNSLSKNNTTGGGGYYNLDMSTGKLKARDCVLLGGVSAFKCSDDALMLDVERVRCRGGSGAAFRSTGENETTDVLFGDVIAKDFNEYFKFNNPENYTIKDGTELVVSNCATDKQVQIYITDSASIDASNADVYSNRANSAVGLKSNSSDGGTIDNYYSYGNDDGSKGGTENLTIHNEEQKDKTDISGVPTESAVGAWSSDSSDSTSTTTDGGSDSTQSSDGFDNWTPRWAATTDDWGLVSDTEYEGDSALRFAHDGSDSSRYAISWDEVGTPTDVEVLDKFRVPSFSSGSSNGYHARSHLRSSAEGDGENGYWVEVEAPQQGFRLGKYNAGETLTTLARFGTPAENTWYCRRFRAEGDELKVKIWEASDPEPSAWDVSWTDSDHDSGWVGLGSWNADAVQSDYIGIGTGGSSAPSPDAAPSVAWSSPDDGATVSGSTTIRIDASDTEDPPDALTVEYRVDSGSWRSASYDSNADAFIDTWDTETADNGDRNLEARARDSYGNTASTSIGVTVSNGASVETVRSENVGNTSATLVGDLTSLGGADEATVYFEWKEQGGGGWETVGSRTVSSTGEFSVDLSGLTEGQEYTFRAVAETSSVVRGAKLKFTTGNSGGSGLSIEEFNVTDKSTRVWNWFEVDWRVADADGELDTVITELRREGSTVVSESTGVTGDSANFTHELRVRGPVDDVRLSVNDVDNETKSETKSL